MSDDYSSQKDSLEKKEKEELKTIVQAMGGKATPRVKKAELIDQILQLSDVSPEEVAEEVQSSPKRSNSKSSKSSSNSNSNSNSTSNSTSNSRSDSRGNSKDEGPRGRQSKNKKPRDRDEAGDDPISTDPEPVSGYLDLRDEAYGFLRVNGYQPSKDDVYVSVKQVRQLNLRRGDRISGLAVPAHRHEKNPCFQEIITINGLMVDEVGERREFAELTPVSPTEKLELDSKDGSTSALNVINTIAPIAKGQRAFIAGPNKSGKSSVMRDIVSAVEGKDKITTMALLIDVKPEEVTETVRQVNSTEVISTSFDSTVDEHIAVAEMTFERAMRLAEQGEDVLLAFDGATQLARAYNTSFMSSGKIMSSGLDISTVYPLKKLLGSARKFAEGGSLTVVSTICVDSGSQTDDDIYSEIHNIGNSQIRLFNCEQKPELFPAIDVMATSTDNAQLILDEKDLKVSSDLRNKVSSASDHIDGLELALKSI